MKSDENVIFLNPKNSEDGYYIETGWASTGSEKIKLPLDNTVWKIGNCNIDVHNLDFVDLKRKIDLLKEIYKIN